MATPPIPRNSSARPVEPSGNRSHPSWAPADPTSRNTVSRALVRMMTSPVQGSSRCGRGPSIGRVPRAGLEPVARDLEGPDLAAERLGVPARHPDLVPKDVGGVLMPLLPDDVRPELAPSLPVSG